MKYLGQHFLKNRSSIGKIVDALDLQSGDTVIEVGAGHGELTEVVEYEARSMKYEIKIIAIEKDQKLAEQLRKKFSGDEFLEIVEGDALKILPQLISNYQLLTTNYKIVGNIPYYLTGRLLRALSELKHKPVLCVLTVQEEVAERIVACPPRVNPHTHKVVGVGMNRLAAIVQFWAEPKIIARVPKEDFHPVPQVESAVIKLKVKNEKMKIKDADYYAAVRVLFQQPRKTILNNLVGSGAITRKEAAASLKKIGVRPDDRPQNLNIEQIADIAELLAGS
jgi:16S rRNA (adenine1518-N6/adenine1519-N6)-dimethyltransferase